MKKPRGDDALLADMIEAGRNIAVHIADCDLPKFLANRTIQAAVEREIGIMGEAACRVSAGLKRRHPEIPWVKIQAQRHVLVHEYGSIMHDMLWQVATMHVPELLAGLHKFQSTEPDLD